MSETTLADELQWRNLLKDRTFEDVTWVNTTPNVLPWR